MIHTAYTRIIGTAHGTTTTIQAHGVIEGTTTLGITDIVRGDTDMTHGTTDMILGITDMTHGTTEGGIQDSMIHGTMAMQAITTRSITTCIHTIADGMAHGIHIMERFTTGLLMAAATITSVAAAAQAKVYTEDPAMRPYPHQIKP